MGTRARPHRKRWLVPLQTRARVTYGTQWCTHSRKRFQMWAHFRSDPLDTTQEAREGFGPAPYKVSYQTGTRTCLAQRSEMCRDTYKYMQEKCVLFWPSACYRRDRVLHNDRASRRARSVPLLPGSLLAGRVGRVEERLRPLLLLLPHPGRGRRCARCADVIRLRGVIRRPDVSKAPNRAQLVRDGCVGLPLRRRPAGDGGRARVKGQG
jgi:hypothetical protein